MSDDPGQHTEDSHDHHADDTDQHAESDHDHQGDHHGHDHHTDNDDDHDHHHHDVDSVAVAVVTISSSRRTETDPSGDRIVETFEEAGHEVAVRELIPDDFDSVQGTVDRLAGRDDTDVIVTTGGTGVTPDDVTPEAVSGVARKEIPGFGELFRRLSYEEIGTRTIGSRTVAAVVRRTLVFCLPGSEDAVRLGIEEIILPEIGHLVGLATRDIEDASSTEPHGDEDA